MRSSFWSSDSRASQFNHQVSVQSLRIQSPEQILFIHKPITSVFWRTERKTLSWLLLSSGEPCTSDLILDKRKSLRPKRNLSFHLSSRRTTFSRRFPKRKPRKMLWVAAWSSGHWKNCFWLFRLSEPNTTLESVVVWWSETSFFTLVHPVPVFWLWNYYWGTRTSERIRVYWLNSIFWEFWGQ